jgi:hypothetical protein
LYGADIIVFAGIMDQRISMLPFEGIYRRANLSKNMEMSIVLDTLAENGTNQEIVHHIYKIISYYE